MKRFKFVVGVLALFAVLFPVMAAGFIWTLAGAAFDVGSYWAAGFAARGKRWVEDNE